MRQSNNKPNSAISNNPLDEADQQKKDPELEPNKLPELSLSDEKMKKIIASISLPAIPSLKINDINLKEKLYALDCARFAVGGLGIRTFPDPYLYPQEDTIHRNPEILCNDIWFIIISFLPSRAILNLSQSCKILFNLISLHLPTLKKLGIYKYQQKTNNVLESYCRGIPSISGTTEEYGKKYLVENLNTTFHINHVDFIGAEAELYNTDPEKGFALKKHQPK